MARFRIVLHGLAFAGLAIFLAFLSLHSRDPFLLAYINTSFLAGLFLSIFGCMIIVSLDGPFNTFIKGIKLVRRPRMTGKERALTEFVRVSGDGEGDSVALERKSRIKQKRKMAVMLLLYGLALMAWSVLIMFLYYD